MHSKSTARILVVGDIHFCKRSRAIVDIMSERVLEAIKNHKPDHTVFLGDTLDGFRFVDTVYQEKANEFFYSVSLLCPFTLLIGNHDIETKNLFMSHVHGFSALRHYWPVNLVETKCVEFDVNGFLFQAVPYCPNGRLGEGIDTLQSRSGDPIATFCHQEIDGCTTGRRTLTGGDKWKPEWGLGVAGHIHHHNLMRSKSGEVYVLYTGSPYQDKIDESIDKTISLLTFSREARDDYFPVYNRPGYYWHEERIYLGLPVKVEVELTYMEYRSWKMEPDHIYFLRIHGTASELISVEQMTKTQEVRNSGGNVVKINTGCVDKTAPVFACDDIPTSKVLTLEQDVYDEIKANRPHLMEEFDELFGNSSVRK